MGCAVGRAVGRVATVLVAALAVVAVAAVGSGASVASSAAVGADRRLYVISDSVVLGARDALPRAFPGWQVTVAGRPAVFTEVAAAEVAGDAAAVGDVAVVATGYNYPYWDPARFDRSIDSMVGALRAAGAKRIVWVTVREVKEPFVSAAAWAGAQHFVWYLPRVNRHLRDATARHPDLVLADWAAVADRPGLTYDAIHLNAAGATLMSEVIRTAVEGSTRVTPAAPLRVPVAGANGVPVDAAAVALSVTAVDAAHDGYLTVHPCGGPPPLASNLNVTFGRAVANHAVVAPGEGGAVCVSTSVDAHVVVDLAGYVTAGGAVSPAAGRVLDTRLGGPPVPAGGVARVAPPAVPAGARAALVNLTAVDGAAPGYLTLYPCGGDPPLASNVNHGAGDVVPNLAASALGAAGDLCVFSRAAAHVVVDLAAWVVGDGVEAAVPRRLVDTRSSDRRVDPAADLVVEAGAPPGAVAALVNVTLTEPAAAGYATVHPCTPGGAPLASDVNVATGGTAAGTVLAGLDATGRLCVHTSVPTHVVVDLAGWLTPASGYRALEPVRLRDTRTDPRGF